MIRKPGISLFILFKNLLLPPLHTAVHVNLLLPVIILPFNHEKSLPVTYILHIRQVEIAFTHRQLVHGIQNISLPHTVIPDKTIKPGTTRDTRLGDILIVDNIQVL